MKHNFHTHTTRCKHAIGTDEQFVQAALESSFDVLGFADHAPWAFQSDYVSHCRMLPTQWAEYRQSILTLKEKYRGQIDIRLGLECEHYDRYIDQLKRWRDEGCEYFILACHFLHTEEHYPYIGISCREDDEVLRYAEETVKGIRTGLYAYVAHPDLYMMYRDELSPVCMEAADMICQAAKDARMPIEYNLLGLLGEMTGRSRGYPNADFWRYILKWDNDVILGVDAHDPAQLRNSIVWDEGVKRLNALGHRIVDNIL
ncbi:MAG: PHP domain-containing protein [Clostridiales bacterium]|nr:PHP domain-containing protein [Clostridiales bacterium]